MVCQCGQALRPLINRELLLRDQIENVLSFFTC